MADVEFINKSLRSYLELKEFENYSKLIQEVLKDNIAIEAKYNLYCLLMNHMTERLCVENLSRQLRQLYCSDKNVEAYVNEAVDYNPKMGYVSIDSKSRRDMSHDYSLYIRIPCSNDNADDTVKRAKEVLTMILMEAKTVCP